MKVKTIYEYGIIKLENEHLKILDNYKKRIKHNFYDVAYNKVIFKNYVGVLKVGNLQIEVLPKIDNVLEGESKLWRDVLVDMLRECSKIKINTLNFAKLKSEKKSFFDLYVEPFLNEVKGLKRQGLIKKYHTVEENCKSLKGKLLLTKHLKKNYINKQYFYVSHNVYDTNNIYNQIIYMALMAIQEIGINSKSISIINGLLLDYPYQNNIYIDKNTFDKLIYDRMSIRYKNAISIAKLILLQYQPMLTKGKEDVIAFMFDMNNLWQEYVKRQLVKVKEITFESKNSTDFWKIENKINDNTNRKIIADMLIWTNDNSDKLVLDTKWKLEKNILNSADLKQMFVYNLYFKCKTAILLVPAIKTEFICKGPFEKLEGVNVSECIVAGINIIKNGKLNPSLGMEIYYQLILPSLLN